MPRLIFAAQSARNDAVPSLSGERLVNMHAVPAPEGARAALILRNVLGTRDWATIEGPFLRAMATCGDQIYTASRGALARISSGGSVSTLDSITDDPETTIVGAGGERVAVCAGGAYYLWDGSSLTQVGGGRLTNIGSVAYLSGYVFMTQADGREVEWTSGSGGPGSRNALYFSEAAARGDKIIRAMAVGPYIWVLKERSIETWQLTGVGGTGAFAPIPGAVKERGLRSFNLACPIPDGLFFIGDDNCAYAASAGGMQAVSTPPVDQALASGEPTHCLYYEDRGHRFAVIRFADRPAWCLDFAMNRWHERAEGVELGPWDAMSSASCYGQWQLGGRLGRVWRLGQEPIDASGPMRRLAVSRTLEPGGRFTVAKFELFGNFGHQFIEEDAPAYLLDEFGFPLRDSNGYPIHAESPEPVTRWRRSPNAWLRFSRDGGNTWGAPKLRSFGKLGAYSTTLSVKGMGQFKRMMTAEISMTDPVEMPLFAEAEIT